MENNIVIFFEGHFVKRNAEILLQDEIDIDFDGQIMIRFLNSNGVLTAINGVDGWGNNILHKIAFKDAEVFYKQ